MTGSPQEDQEPDQSLLSIQQAFSGQVRSETTRENDVEVSNQLSSDCSYTDEQLNVLTFQD